MIWPVFLGGLRPELVPALIKVVRNTTERSLTPVTRKRIMMLGLGTHEGSRELGKNAYGGIAVALR